MISPLHDMRVKRVLDAADLGAFMRLPEAQVYGESGGGVGPHNRFLQVAKRRDGWHIGPGFVEGTPIRGSNARLPSSGAVWVVAKVDREIKTTPIGGGVLHYRTGRYVIMDAWLHPEPVNDFDLESARFVSTSRFLFTLGADGAPPANYAGAQHFRIDPYALAL